MEKIFPKPFPARAVVEVSKLPKDALIEIDAIANKVEQKTPPKSSY